MNKKTHTHTTSQAEISKRFNDGIETILNIIQSVISKEFLSGCRRFLIESSHRPIGWLIWLVVSTLFPFLPNAICARIHLFTSQVLELINQ